MTDDYNKDIYIPKTIDKIHEEYEIKKKSKEICMSEEKKKLVERLDVIVAV